MDATQDIEHTSLDCQARRFDMNQPPVLQEQVGSDNVDTGGVGMHIGQGGGLDPIGDISPEGWRKRVRLGNASDERRPNPSLPCALEVAIRNYAERKTGEVVYPAVGIRFDSPDEAYNGFGVRLSKCILNVHRKKVYAQEIVCRCAVSNFWIWDPPLAKFVQSMYNRKAGLVFRKS